MKRAALAVLVLFILLFTLPALAQDLKRIDVPDEGQTFTVNLKSDSFYIVDPFEPSVTPETKLVESCSGLVNLDKVKPKTVSYNTQLRTPEKGKRCALQLRVTEIKDGNRTMTFIRVRKEVEIKVTSDWQKKKLGRGSYAILWGKSEVHAELDLDRSSAGCSKAHDGNIETYGIEGYEYQGKAILDSSDAWYRILPQQCKLWYRGLNGSKGKITLLKLSDKTIWPADD